jgi:hypothetical protein
MHTDPVMSWGRSGTPGEIGDVAAPDQGFLADFGVSLLILPSFSRLEIGLFYTVRLAIYWLCPGYFRHGGRKTHGQRGYILSFLAKSVAIWWL